MVNGWLVPPLLLLQPVAAVPASLIFKPPSITFFGTVSHPWEDTRDEQHAAADTGNYGGWKGTQSQEVLFDGQITSWF